MAYSEMLANKIRDALSHLPQVMEKKMFGGLAFIVSNKMCISVGANRIMCRIDPVIHEKVIKRKGCHTVVMGGREHKGYVYVDEKNIKNKKYFDYWIGLALNYNKVAKT